MSDQGVDRSLKLEGAQGAPQHVRHTTDTPASGRVPVLNIELTYKSITTRYEMRHAHGKLRIAGTHTYDASTNQRS